MSYKRVLKKAGKIVLYILGSALLLVCLLLLFINMPVGRKMVKNKVQSYLQAKLKTKITIGSIDYSLPKWIEINGIYLEDQQKDTLLFGEKIFADINMIKLIWGSTDIHKLSFKNVSIYINRAEKDSFFNFQFILDAFAGNKPSSPIAKDTAALKLTLDRLLLDHVSLKFKDRNAGNDFDAAIINLDASLNQFQPDRLKFGIKDFTASGINFFMHTYKETISEPSTAAVEDNNNSSNYGLYITASKLDLRNANVIVDNKISGMYYANNVTHIALNDALFDLNGAVATGDELILDSSFVKFINPKTIKDSIVFKNTGSSTETASVPWLIKAKQVSLKNNHVEYDDNNMVAAGGFDPSHFNMQNLGADISSLVYSSKRTAAEVKQLTFSDTSGFVLDTTHVNFLMTDSILSAKDLYVKTAESLLKDFIELQFDSINGITKNPANSLLAAKLNNSTIAFNDLYLLVPSLKASFPPAQFADNLVHFNTEVRGNLAQVYLPYLQLVGFSGSSLDAHATLYNLTDANKFYYDLYIERSNFKKSDLLKFVPAENQQSLAQLPDIINLRGRITGNRENLASDIQTNGKGIALNGKFTLNNISDPAKLKYDFMIRSSSFDRAFIMGIIPPNSLPPEITLPEKNYVTGTLTGNPENLVADLKLDGSYGLVTVKGYIKNIKDKDKASYDLYVTTKDYAVGKLIGQDSVIGNVTGAFTAKGTGLDYKTMRASINADIASAGYNHYNYINAKFKADLNQGNIASTGTIDDPSLKLNYDLVANVKQDYPTVKGIIRVDTAQLKQLNFYPDTLNFSLTADIDSKNLQPRNLDASLLLDSIRMQFKNDFYQVDSVSLVGTSSAGIDSIVLKAPFAEVHAGGAFDYDKVAISVQQYINKYYKIPGYQPTTTTIPDQQVAVNGVVKNSPIITAFVPGLQSYDDINFNGSYTSAGGDSALQFSATMPRVIYASNVLSNGKVGINSTNEKINYEVSFDTLKTAGSTLYASSVKGSAANDSISLTARTQDNKKKDWFAISGTAAVSGETYSFRIQDTLLLNYERWNVAPGNYFSYSPNGVIANNIVLTSDTSTISIKSQQLVENSPIDVNIDNFHLKSIMSLVNQDTLLVGGTLDVKGSVSELDKEVPAFTGTASIENLSYQQNLLGNLTANASKESDNNIAGNITLTGNGNDVEAKGNYYLNNSENQFDADVQFKRLNFRTLEGISGGQIKNASGAVYGEVKANGRFNDPRWSGQINFDTTRFTLTQLGAPYKIDKQKIVFEYPDIKFPEFIIKDSLDHPLKLDGAVSIRSMEDIGVNVDINTNDFIFINAKRSINNQIYGHGSLDANISVTGTAQKPNIEGDIRVNDESDLTIVLPEASYAKNDGKTIVRFIDRDTFDVNPPSIGFEEAEKPTAAFASFLNYNLNIEMSKEAALTILVDPVTGDEIKVQGDARLNAGVDPGGHIVLAGVYELDKGYYDLHYQFLERKFNLIKGSTITFAGEPLNSTVDITAEYIANTNSKDLLSGEVSDVTPALANSFNQKLPFRVILKLTGKLSKPEINFDIELPDQNSSLLSTDLRTTIENKLQQIRSDPSSINKQVFSLLLLGRFVGEQSSDFFKGNGGDFSNLARQSVSQFLSSALNQIAGDIFKGIDIDLNLNSYNDFSDGGNTERTDLNVAVSKRFANDRLTISVGQNFGIEGQDAAAKAAGSNSGFKPDVTVSYKLTKDGRYLLRAYTKNQFEVTVDGYVMETGLAFIVTMDYNKFNELFRKRQRRTK